ncbi:hypothetical protein [Rhizobium sp. MHM7A]|uniref:hypothetical protein n=1 Tax=Rhizobium sp. MHM7A TaxID=2583233 RepID=UPI001105D13D|nr:hypothetical protein [Rhizobium sp. MHM7A]TLX16097.1 hypothetical protein FFR93_01885 [Rhizobium sp. MHM7A]
MDSENKQRGYDDSALLKRMADGLVSREFGSVDEGAKAVLGEDTGSNVDRLRRKFREQGWYEKGLEDYVEAQIAERGLIQPNFGAKLCVRAEEACRNPMPVLNRLSKVLFVLMARDYDLDGRRITKLERLGGFLRVVTSISIPFIVCQALVYLIRKESTQFGMEMLQLAGCIMALAIGMYWNRVAVGGDFDAYVAADTQWKKAEREKRAERRRRYTEERRESELRRQKIDMETT